MSPAGRRPDPAGQEPTAPTSSRPRRSTSTGSPTTVLAKARGLGDRDWVLGREPASGRRPSTSSGSPRRCSSSPTTRSSTPGPATWSRSARRTTGRACALWVRDTGPGVPAEDREHDLRAVRPQRRPGPSDEGFGLGLSIVRAIAEAHGGTVHVEDAVPRGARFVITLPTAPRIGPSTRRIRWPAS